MSAYPKVSGLAAWSENCKWYSSLPLGLYRYFVSQSSEFCLHNSLCCFSTSNTEGKLILLYRLSPETFGYTLMFSFYTRYKNTQKLQNSFFPYLNKMKIDITPNGT